jgi:aspartate aminotransferase/aminotransferase
MHDVGMSPAGKDLQIVRRPAQRAIDLPRSGIRAVMDLAATVPDVIHLEVGEPNFPTPAHIVEAGADAARAGYTKYTASRGYLSLREALVEKLRTMNEISSSVDQITVTSVAVKAMFDAFHAILDPRDTVLIPDPGWPNTEMMITLAGGRPVRYPLLAAARFEPDLDALRELALRERPKAIYLNSPGNPTGAVFTKGTIEAICAIAESVDAYVVSDECYEAITFDSPHHSPGAIAPERVLAAFSFSKTYAMTGWRVGYLVAPTDVSDVVVKITEPVISCASAVSQKAAEAALSGPQAIVGQMVAAYRMRRDAMVEALSATGLLATTPSGAFYVMADIGRSGLSGRDFALRLVRERGVAVAPGDTFGPAGRDLIRISLASDLASLEEGAKRIIDLVDEVGQAAPVSRA